jgi:undecaprenyl pyrophosphate phosphatase UppP
LPFPEDFWGQPCFARKNVELLSGTQVAVFAVILWIADQRPPAGHMDSLKIRDAVIIGTAQAAALAPGVSRSGDHDLGRPTHGTRP